MTFLRFLKLVSYCLISVCLSIGQAVAQKSNQKKKYSTKSSQAIKQYEQATDFYNKKQDAAALESLLKAIQSDSNFIEAHIMLAGVYSDSDLKEKGISEYRTAIRIKPDFFPNVFYSMAILLLETGQYGEAAENFRKFLTYPVNNSGLLRNTKRFLGICEFGINAVNHPVPYDPKNLGEKINTKFGEYSPAVTADENFLFFTSIQPRNGNAREEDIYFSEKTDSGWTRAGSVGPPVNTDANEGTVSIAPDGKTLYFTVCGREDGFGSCDIYEVKKIGNRWTQLKNLGQTVNSRSFDSQPSIASDGRTLYFVSNRPGGTGATDIYKTVKNDLGVWSVPVNLGKTINTIGSEQSPFIHPDNKTLYFSSDELPGLGGNDFFYSRMNEKGEWQTPVNLGYPINTFANERNFIVNAKGDYAYIATDRLKEKNDFDLYKFELYPEARPLKVSYLKGRVFDKDSRNILEAKFELIDLASGKTIIESFSNKGNGEFLVCIPAGENYALNVSAAGYLFYSDNFSLKTLGKEADDVFTKDVPMIPVRKGESVVLKNIFFETNSFQLKDESKVELNKLVAFLKDNSQRKIELGGYTDNDGD